MQRPFGNFCPGMRNRYPTRFGWVLELMVTSFNRDLKPPIRHQQLDKFTTSHLITTYCCVLYTPLKSGATIKYTHYTRKNAIDLKLCYTLCFRKNLSPAMLPRPPPNKTLLHKHSAITIMRTITNYILVASLCRRSIIQFFSGSTVSTTVG